MKIEKGATPEKITPNLPRIYGDYTVNQHVRQLETFTEVYLNFMLTIVAVWIVIVGQVVCI
jgi:hypothetical protein